MVRFVSSLDQIYRVLRQEDDGAWLISFDEPASPFFVSAEEFAAMERIETPSSYLLATAQELTQAAQERLDLLRSLLEDDACITSRDRRLQVAKGIAEEYGTTAKRVLRLFYRYLATGTLTGRRNREPEKRPDYDWAIQKFYFSSKKFSLRAAFDMLLVQRYTDGIGRLAETVPTWSSFQHYYYRSGYHKTPQKIIARQGLSHYQRNVRPMFGSASSWRDRPGSFQMDATQADIYLVSRHDRSSVIGRPYIYLAVDTATQLIAGLYVGLEAGEIAVMQCLAQAADDKVEFAKKYGIELSPAQWPNSGMPSEIITDKGREFLGNRMGELCRRYGIEVQSLPPFRPDGKGLVEKAFDLIQRRYKPLLRGKGVIEKDAQERWAIDYRSQAVLTIDEFTAVVIQCVIHINAGRLLSSGSTPAELWLSSKPELLPVDGRELYCMVLPREKVNLTRKGIYHNGLWYIPERKDRDWITGTYEAAVNNHDSSKIYVVLDGEYFSFCLKDQSAQYQGLTMQEVQIAKVQERRQRAERKQMESASSTQTLQAIQQIVDTAAADGQGKERQTGTDIKENRVAEERRLT